MPVKQIKAIQLTTVLASDAMLDVVSAFKHHNRQWVLSSIE
jgi:hypothetical protein